MGSLRRTILVGNVKSRYPSCIVAPVPLLWPLSWGQELVSQLTRKANVFSHKKYAELRAPGWVCDAAKLRSELGLECPTGLAEGVRRTVRAYRESGWL